ncbi:hypothetical protein B0H12DRAFT_1155016 [Mycena haematopus]|nr:hypothetical protein B0H12DRAFT_1155016 [Mycena haematopus]
MSIIIDDPLFAPLPKIVPPDAQTLPPPPSIPEHPECLFYGWMLTPLLFGSSPTRLNFSDGSSIMPERPTTVTEAYDTFRFFVRRLNLRDGIRFDQPISDGPWFAYMAEASKSVGGVRSVLDTDKILSVARLQKLEHILDLQCKPQWISARRRSSEEVEAILNQMAETLPDHCFPFGRAHLAGGSFWKLSS